MSEGAVEGTVYWARTANYVRDLRASLAEMQRYRCAYCLCEIRTGATLDHVWPRSKRGPTNYDNCVAACRRCNSERGNGSHWKFYKHVRKERASNRRAP